MAAGDLIDFRVVGQALARLGLVKGSEGNLSTFDGRLVRITRTGAKLDRLGPDDLVDWTPETPTESASSDLEKHLMLYRQQDARAVVHAHPPGSVPEGWTEGEPHGTYAHGLTLEQALASVHASRGRFPDDRRRGDGLFVRIARPAEFEDHRPLRSGDLTFPHGALRLIDQTLLPAEERSLLCTTVQEVAQAIRRLAVRGAPVLGIAAAYAMVLAARGRETADRDAILHELEAAAKLLVGTRPTAVNIRWGVERVLARARAEPAAGGIPDAALDEARRIEVEDAEACSAIGRVGAELVPDGANVLTHCNTGMLCTAGIGTAQGVIYRAHLEGKGIHVWVDETRPVWQGARLTAWELSRLEVPFRLVADTAAGSLMAGGKVDLVITGADRIAADGSVANKVGTYGLAVLASHHGIPFYVAAPISTIDPSSTTGAEIAIEERDQAEVTAPFGLAVAPNGTVAFNPAFDLTPAALVSAIVTERGVVRPPFEVSLRRLLDERISA
jgi:methylthioribose-1-phosphate isomerase